MESADGDPRAMSTPAVCRTWRNVRLGIAGRLARCVAARRNPARVTQGLADIVRARILAIACGGAEADDLASAKAGGLLRVEPTISDFSHLARPAASLSRHDATLADTPAPARGSVRRRAGSRNPNLLKHKRLLRNR